jgi:DNA-binding transcriptional LysR family regulator
VRFERLDLNLLVALNALIEERNVSAAARRLHISQPAMSGSLNRLRDFFGDELLVPAGRQMALTQRGEELHGPVRDALNFIRFRITTPTQFDPATSDRRFTIGASDYAYDVLIADAIAAASAMAPGVSFEVTLSGPGALERLDRGELDLFFTIDDRLNDEHPKQALFEDEHVVVCWSGSRYGASIGRAEFLAAPHAIAVLGPESFPSFIENFFKQHKIQRRVEVSLPSFSALPHALMGTDRLATMYRRHAEYFAGFLPLVLHEPPIALPAVREMVQWHRVGAEDAGLKWLLNVMAKRAASLAPRRDQ